VELGAHWIHGILGNPLYELALRDVKYYYHYSLYGSTLISRHILYRWGWYLRNRMTVHTVRVSQIFSAIM
jgi:hypothetical protein